MQRPVRCVVALAPLLGKDSDFFNFFDKLGTVLINHGFAQDVAENSHSVAKSS